MKKRLTSLLFLSLITLGFTASGSSLVCHHTDSMDDLKKLSCEAECEAYYQQNPEARPSNRQGVCDIEQGFIQRLRDPEFAKSMLSSCGDGVWEGILSIPEQLKVYAALIGGAFERVTSPHKNINICDQDLGCKTELARSLALFSARDENGDYTLPDEKVQQWAKVKDVTHILKLHEQERVKRLKACVPILSRLRSQKYQVSIKTQGGWSPNDQIEIYNEIKAQHPECVTPLNLTDPTLPSPTPEPTWLATLGVKLQCYNSKKVAELTCYEITSLVADPLVLASGGGALAYRALRSAGIKTEARGIAKATGTETTPNSNPSTSELRNPSEKRLTSQAKNQRNTVNQKKRERLIKEQLNKEYTSEAQNMAWIRMADEATEQKGYRFVDIENTQIKKLNDVLDNKDLVTSMTSRHKQIIIDNMHDLKSKYPDLEILPYTDFKSVRFAIKPPLPKGLDDELAQIFEKSNTQFQNELLSNGIVRSSDNPQSWFRGGLGDTADQANIAARISRESSEVKLTSYSNPETRQKLSQNLEQTEILRQKLVSSQLPKNLFESVNGGSHHIPHREVFDLSRKHPDDTAFKVALETTYKQKMDFTDIDNLRAYIDKVDGFAAGVRIGKREVATVTGADKGALAMDFTGMGAYNLRETALALTRSSNIDNALTQSRVAEKNVTQMFKRRMNERIRIIDNYLGDKKQLGSLNVRCSGDDCVFILPSKISLKEERELIQRLSRTEGPSDIRLSFINQRVTNPTSRTQMANHGETLEKLTRKELMGQIPDSLLKDLTFGVSMRGEAAGQGGVQLLIGNSKKALNNKDRRLIQQAFERATNKLNQDVTRASRVRSQYQPLKSP